MTTCWNLIPCEMAAAAEAMGKPTGLDLSSSLLPSVDQHAASIIIMPVKQLDTPYPLIDADPHFSRVVRSFRGSDYAAWAGATAAFPSAIYMMELFDPTRPKRGLGSALRLSTFLGMCGGFLFAYQRSSFRFWGWRENEIEQQANKAALDAGIKPPGTDPSKSDLSEYMQGVAHRNSAFSQLKFSTLPWFNLVDHPYHGTQQESSSS